MELYQRLTDFYMESLELIESMEASLVTLLLSCCAQMRMLIGQTRPDWIASTQWKNKTTEDKLREVS